MSSSLNDLVNQLNQAQSNARRDAASLRIAKKEADQLRLQLHQLRLTHDDLSSIKLPSARQKFLETKSFVFSLSEDVNALEKYRDNLRKEIDENISNWMTMTAATATNDEKENNNAVLQLQQQSSTLACCLHQTKSSRDDDSINNVADELFDQQRMRTMWKNLLARTKNNFANRGVEKNDNDEKPVAVDAAPVASSLNAETNISSCRLQIQQQHQQQRREDPIEDFDIDDEIDYEEKLMSNFLLNYELLTHQREENLNFINVTKKVEVKPLEAVIAIPANRGVPTMSLQQQQQQQQSSSACSRPIAYVPKKPTKWVPPASSCSSTTFSFLRKEVESSSSNSSNNNDTTNDNFYSMILNGHQQIPAYPPSFSSSFSSVSNTDDRLLFSNATNISQISSSASTSGTNSKIVCASTEDKTSCPEPHHLNSKKSVTKRVNNTNKTNNVKLHQRKNNNDDDDFGNSWA